MRGLSAPEGMAILPDGSLLIAEQGRNRLVRPAGTLETLADLPTPDDVVADSAGNIYVCTLGDRAIHVISATTHQRAILVSGLGSPQGLIFGPDGNLIVTDPGHHQLLKVIIR